ncbi:MAG: sialate O-acetylesterase [Puniceicoccaceae bacterium 5H]|nr:MAG: sialate O-acetylesterase [Puniceicoccaceae bacterium 5H]
MKALHFAATLGGLFASLAPLSQANVILPRIFGDHMVLQRNEAVEIWGFANAGEEVTVTASWADDAVATVKTPPTGHWSVHLQTPDAGGPYTIHLKGYNEVELADVLIGEVWLCTGQSNMQWNTKDIDDGDQIVAAADHPNIRLFTVEHVSAEDPQIDLYGQWQPCTPDSVPYFSAIGYIFGRELNQELDVPIGLVSTNWGGTSAEVWIPAEAIKINPQLREDQAKFTPVEWGPIAPGSLYNAMIAPLIPYNIAGAIWYQGESNVGMSRDYAELIGTLVSTWRNAWDDDFSFYLAQIAPWTYGEEGHAGAKMRDDQRRAAEQIPNSGLVVTSDTVTDTTNIHPTNKVPVGQRFAKLALAQHYGLDVAYSGPMYDHWEAEGSKARIYFRHADGLHTDGKSVDLFEIAGEDGEFYPAQAEIDGDTVVLSSPQVEHPTGVRYAWGNTDVVTLFNGDDLPAPTFQSAPRP